MPPTRTRPLLPSLAQEATRRGSREDPRAADRPAHIQRGTKMVGAHKLTRTELERVCRLCRTNRDAAEALGVQPNSLRRAAKREGLQTPSQRRQAQQEDGCRT